MFSRRMAMWSSPRPDTLKESGDTKSIFNPTFTSSSRSRYSRSCRLVTYFPSRAGKGFCICISSYGFTNVDIGESGNHHDVTCICRLYFRTLDPLEGEDLGDLAGACLA